MVNDPGFFNWVTAKYAACGQRYRRFPVLTFLLIPGKSMQNRLNFFLFPQFEPIPREGGLENESIRQNHTNYYFNLNRTLLFNINLLTRIAGKSQTFIKDLLKIVGTIPRQSRTLLKIPIPGVESIVSNLLEVSFIERIKKRSEFPLTIVSPLLNIIRNVPKTIPLPGERTSPDEGRESHDLPIPAAGKKSPLPPLYESREPSTEVKQTLERLGNSMGAKAHHSTALFKPSITVTTLRPVSTGFKPLSFFLTPPGRPGVGDSEKPTLSHSTSFNAALDDVKRTVDDVEHRHSVYPESGQLAQTLYHSTSFNAALDDVKRTVANVEKKVTEELMVTKKSFREHGAVSRQGPGISPGMTADIEQLTDRVYRMLERKILIEKERRGF